MEIDGPQIVARTINSSKHIYFLRAETRTKEFMCPNDELVLKLQTCFFTDTNDFSRAIPVNSTRWLKEPKIFGIKIMDHIKINEGLEAAAGLGLLFNLGARESRI